MGTLRHTRTSLDIERRLAGEEPLPATSDADTATTGPNCARAGITTRPMTSGVVIPDAVHLSHYAVSRPSPSETTPTASEAAPR